MKIQVTRMEGLWPNRLANFEVLPFVEFVSSQPDSNLKLQYNFYQRFSENYIFERGFLRTEDPTALLNEAFDLLAGQTKLADASENFSELERRAYLLSWILRRGLYSNDVQNFMQVTQRWIDFKLKSKWLDKKASEIRSISILFDELVNLDLPAFYRKLEPIDFINWGFSNETIDYLDDFGWRISDMEPIETRELPFDDDRPTPNEYWSLASHLVINESNLLFKFAYDFDHASMALVVLEKKSKSDEPFERARLVPKSSSLITEMQKSKKTKFSVDEFCDDFLYKSFEIIKFLESVFRLKIAPLEIAEWVRSDDREFRTSSTKSAFESYQNYLNVKPATVFRDVSDVFVLGAFLIGDVLLFNYENHVNAFESVLVRHFMRARQESLYIGRPEPEKRLANLLANLIPQIEFNESRRLNRMKNIVGEMTPTEINELINISISFDSLGDFFQKAEKTLLRIMGAEMEFLNNSAKIRLASTTESQKFQGPTGGIDAMKDGLYRTYGAER